MLVIRPGEGDLKDTVPQIIWLGKRETEEHRRQGSVPCTSSQRKEACAAAAQAPSASSPESTSQ